MIRKKRFAGLPDGDVYAQASFWFLRLRDQACSPAVDRAFDLWIAEDPEHQRVYQQVVARWKQTGTLAEREELRARVDTMRDEAARACVKPPSNLMVSARLRWAVGSAAAMAAMVCAIVFFSQPAVVVPPLAPDSAIFEVAELAPQEAPASLAAQTARYSYETAIGERSTITLPDNSVLDLNTDTALRIDFSPEARKVLLLRGQALFKVEGNPDRPFIVTAGNRVITAVGTEFEVRKEEDDVAVTLVEGKVEVRPIALVDATIEAVEIPQPITLQAGERVRAVDNRVVKVSEDAMTRALVWRDGLVSFENESLSEVVAELNRYSRRKLVLADDGLEELRIWGTFRAGSSDGFVSALTTRYPVVAREVDTGEVSVIIEWQQ
jgi:transmembrane sensor